MDLPQSHYFGVTHSGLIVTETILIWIATLAVVGGINRYLLHAIWHAALRRRKKTVFMAALVVAGLWLVSVGLCLASFLGAWALVATRPGFQQLPVALQISMLIGLGTAALWAAEAGKKASLGQTSHAPAYRPLTTKGVVGYMTALAVLISMSVLAFLNADAIGAWARQHLLMAIGRDATAGATALAIALPPVMVLALTVNGLARLWSMFWAVVCRRKQLSAD